MIRLLLLQSSLLAAAAAKEECYAINGKVECEFADETTTSRVPVGKVQVDLMDEDSFSSELMGRTWTDDEGYFNVTGCGSDFGSWNSPDPYLKFFHKCPISNGAILDERRVFNYYSLLPIPLPVVKEQGTITLK
ncbi:hypothetical protein PRIPAC_91878 [Pristionchus pacificus]|uniref:Uncharacterized protein n=1 Tax=Pristionchus pacificus TaxID=54126 RepID=A0A2A6BA57_PRIPA|nr:hypothetical protein PRIPAC_91878 [Pristionchus pacificus]|eukprot:PDM62772.1 hypothetical protein PRIPAC_49987 [Pristionchus pacificus]